MKIDVLYSVRVPFDTTGNTIEAFWDDDEQSYDWRVVRDGNVITPALKRGYGSAEIALRDALVELS